MLFLRDYTIQDNTPVLTEVVVKHGKAEMQVGETYRFTGEARYNNGLKSEDVS